MDLNIGDCYVAVESREALEGRDNRICEQTSFLFGGWYCTLETVSAHGRPIRARFTESPSRKRASIPDPERMVQAAPTFGISLSEKRTLDLVTDHPMIPREHLARWLGVSEGGSARRCTAWALPGAWSSVEKAEATLATPCRPRASATSPTGTAPSSRPREASGAPPSLQTVMTCPQKLVQ